MIKGIAGVCTAAFLVLAGTGTASAGLIASLTFTTPTGTVYDTDSIPIDLTLALDPNSDALITDGAGNVISGLPADLTPYLFSPIDKTGVNLQSDTLSTVLNESLTCSTSFLIGCGDAGSPYSFNFSSFFPSSNFELDAGNSYTNLFGTFNPDGGTAPDGTYTLPHVSLFIQVYDASILTDPNDPNSELHIADIPIADTTQQPSFTRDVISATPEPGTWFLTLSGLAAAVSVARRKSGIK